MALKTNAPGRYACNYWQIRGKRWVKEENLTAVDIAGYIDAEDRNDSYPTARDSTSVVLPGDCTISEAYAAIKTLHGWTDATDV